MTLNILHGNGALIVVRLEKSGCENPELTGMAVKTEAGKPLTWRRGAVIVRQNQKLIREENLKCNQQ